MAAGDERAFVEAIGAAGNADGVVAAPSSLAGSAVVRGMLADRPTVVVHPGRRPGDEAAAAGGVRTIWGRGVDGYRWALHHLAHRVEWPWRTLAYGPGPEQVGDLRVPAGTGPHPVAVLVHGGFWLAPWERDLMEGVAVDLARRGIATWNLEYRRVGAGGGWPATADDVTDGVVHVGALAREHGLDPAGAVLVGHSAGAHLALVAASRGLAPMRSVVGLASLTDLAAAARQGLGGGAVDRFLAGAEPSEASPIARLPLGIPQLLAHVRGDPLVPFDQTRRYAAAASEAGDPVTLSDFSEGDHFSLIDASSAAWRQVAAALDPGGPPRLR